MAKTKFLINGMRVHICTVSKLGVKMSPYLGSDSRRYRDVIKAINDRGCDNFRGDNFDSLSANQPLLEHLYKDNVLVLGFKLIDTGYLCVFKVTRFRIAVEQQVLAYHSDGRPATFVGQTYQLVKTPGTVADFVSYLLRLTDKVAFLEV